MADEAVSVDVGGRRLALRNLDKVLYPETGFTKAEVVGHYAAVAPVLLAHLARRPVTLKRFPDGVDREGFFEKRCPSHRPDWVHTAPMPGGGGRGRNRSRTAPAGPVPGCLLEEPAALVWTANLAAIEVHVPLSTADAPGAAQAVVFDLDPGPPADEVACARVALRIRTLLDALGLVAWVKTTGSKGLHVWVPLDPPASFEETQAFARVFAGHLAGETPDEVTDRMDKARRAGRVFVDWGQNGLGRTMVAPYSLRATPRPRVSTPVRWDEVDAAVAAGDPDRLRFGPEAVRRRVAGDGDLFAGVLTARQTLPGSG